MGVRGVGNGEAFDWLLHTEAQWGGPILLIHYQGAGHRAVSMGCGILFQCKNIVIPSSQALTSTVFCIQSGSSGGMGPGFSVGVCVHQLSMITDAS